MLYLIGIVCTAVLIFFDQFTKRLAVLFLEPDVVHTFIDGFLEFKYDENSYPFFGLLPVGTWFFIICAVIIPVVFIYFYIKPLFKGMRVFLVLGFAGAAGNIVNIFQHGCVVNFLRFEFINVPIINLADVYIICGSLFLLIITFIPNKKDKKSTAR